MSNMLKNMFYKWIIDAACMRMRLFFVVFVVLDVVLVHSALFICILHCLKAPLSALPPHANKSLLSLFDFANANQSLAERTGRPTLQSTKQVPDVTENNYRN